MKASASKPQPKSLSMDVYGDHQEIAGIFNLFILVILLGFGAGIIFDLSRNNPLGSMALGICIVPVLASWYFVRRNQFEKAATILAIILLSMITFVSMFGEGIHQVSVLAYPTVLIVASMVIRKRVMIFLTLYNIGCVSWLIFGDLFGLFTPDTASTTAGEFVIIAIILVSTAYMVGLLTETLFQNNLRLQRELQERKQAEDALRTSEALYQKAIEVASAIPYHQTYHAHGHSVEYDFIGDGIRQITGYGPEEFNEDLWDSLSQERVLLDELAQYSFDDATQKVRSGVHPVWKCNHRIRAKDGSIHWVFEAAVELRDQNGISHGSIGMFQDITERKQAQALQEAVYQIAIATETTKSLDDLYPQIHHIISSVMPAENFYITLYNEAKNSMRFPYFRDAVDEPYLGEFDPGKGLTAYVLRTGKSLLCTQAVHDELERLGAVNLLGVPSAIWLGVPLIIEGRTIGAMVVQHYTDPNAYGEREQHMLEFVSTQVASAISRKQAEEEILNISKFTEENPNPVLRIRRKGEILFANQSSTPILNAWGCAVGQNVPEDWQRQIEGIFESGRNKEVEIEYADRVFSCVLAPIADGGYVNIYGRDITEQKRAESEREKLITELETKNAELERFTYTVSHDLKSPLVTINGFLGFLEIDATSGNRERLNKDMQRIRDAVGKMHALLNELLELSRIGRMMNAPENIPFESLVKDAMDIVHGQLEARHVTVQIQPNLPIVHGDRQRLVEILQNLIDNAIKYMGDQSEPLIQIGQNGEEDGKPVFFVRDNGMGIAPEYHERIFGLFNKLDARSEGTGVGLALVKRIIEFHGSRIWVESEAGKGSIFYFTLPRA